jgi:hypothetical protein
MLWQGAKWRILKNFNVQNEECHNYDYKLRDNIYLWSEVLCFIVCHIEISLNMTLHAMILVFSKKFKWIGVHWFGLRLFGIMVWKLLIIEPFFQWKLNKIKTENCIGILGRSWCYWKAISNSDLRKFIFQISKLRCGRYWFLNGFFCCKFKKLQKWVWNETLIKPLMCSQYQISKISIPKMWKTKNVFTLGPTT